MIDTALLAFRRFQALAPQVRSLTPSLAALWDMIGDPDRPLDRDEMLAEVATALTVSIELDRLCETPPSTSVS